MSAVKEYAYPQVKWVMSTARDKTTDTVDVLAPAAITKPGTTFLVKTKKGAIALVAAEVVKTWKMPDNAPEAAFGTDWHRVTCRYRDPKPTRETPTTMVTAGGAANIMAKRGPGRPRKDAATVATVATVAAVSAPAVDATVALVAELTAMREQNATLMAMLMSQQTSQPAAAVAVPVAESAPVSIPNAGLAPIGQPRRTSTRKGAKVTA